MLRLSKKGDYGIEVLVTLAKLKNNERMAINQIAKERNLPSYFLSQVMSALKKAELVHSKEGVGGGYSLAKRPDKISLLEILETFEGKAVLVECLENKSNLCKREAHCLCKRGWSRLGDQLVEFFKNKSLQELINLSN